MTNLTEIQRAIIAVLIVMVVVSFIGWICIGFYVVDMRDAMEVIFRYIGGGR